MKTPKEKAIGLISQFGCNSKYVVLEIKDAIKKFEYGYPVLSSNRLSYWTEVMHELEKL